jgi:hypothetical protein
MNDPSERLARLTKAVRRDLLRVLTAEPDVRADVVRQFHERGDEDLVELLTELEADDVLRVQVVEVLQGSLRTDAEP